VNVGGVHSPGLATAENPYTDVVIPTITKVLLERGYDVQVAGNLGPETRSRLGETGVQAELLSHAEFLTALAAASILVTSPGLTTILEAGAVGIPTVLLPPQNLSQMLNTELVTELTPTQEVVGWPPGFLDGTRIHDLRRQGEMAAVRYIYSTIERMSRLKDIRTHLAESMSHSLPPSGFGLTAYAAFVGSDGAARVASIVRDLHVNGPRKRRAPK
jgi:hydroxymethylcytosylglucuronate/cytosylglucuronate synthase